MDYQLPDVHKNIELLRTTNPDDLAKMRDDVRHHLMFLDTAVTEILENTIMSCCDICADFGHHYMDIPSGWGWLETGNLICDKCVKRWTERFGETPVLNRQGEIVYEHSSVPEDSTHRRQANFDFI